MRTLKTPANVQTELSIHSLSSNMDPINANQRKLSGVWTVITYVSDIPIHPKTSLTNVPPPRTAFMTD